MERERSELRNASPKERKSQQNKNLNMKQLLWKLSFEYVKPLAFGPVYIQNMDSILDNEGLKCFKILWYPWK